MEKIEIIKTPDFLSGGGEMAMRIRSFDWSKTSLGGPEEWSPGLKNVVGLMLVNRFPMLLWWGEEYIQFYNDPYIPIPGLKHPAALGQTGKECWREIWDVLKPLVDTPFKGGPASWMEDILLQINRNNFIEETHFIIAYSPVPDATAANGIGGVLATVNEITDAVISKRQMETLKELGKNISATLSEAEVYTKVTEVFNSNLSDVPFALIYKIENDGTVAALTASSGIDINHPELLHKIYLGNDSPDSADISVAVAENKIVESEMVAGLTDMPKGAWDIMPKCIVHVPVKAANKKFPFAILTIGLNPYRKFDDAYKNFVTLISDQVSLGVNNAIAYGEERKRAEALQELDKAKTIFFSNISHEFRTPLTLMLGTIEEILNDGDTILKNRERITVTHRNAMRLLKLVNTLLDFSRIESGRQKANYTLTDIVSLTKNLAGNFRSVIEKAGLKFIIKADGIIQPVYVDKAMWEKIVFNLLSNAFKYTLEGSITINLFSENDHATLEVEDTGVGIPEKELSHMFERFHRVQNVTGRTYEGTGIGLSLIKELVLLHGGTISVESKERKGSTFTVTIPFGKEHLPAEQTSETAEEFEDVISDAYIEEATSLLETQEKSLVSKKDIQQATILVVDDNPDMRRHIQSLLQKQFNVLTAANGAEALDKIRSENPSLVLSDIMMPVMDGIQLLKEIKNNKDTDQIPVVLLTARAGEESKIEGYETGADDYLVKPFSANELLSRVKAQLDISQKRRHVETQLKEFLMQAPAAIAVFEGSGHFITIANQQFQNVFGRTENQLIGHSVQEAFPEAEEQGIHDLLDNVFLTGKPFSQNAFPASLNIHGLKKIGYYDFILQPIKNAVGEITGIMAHFADVTERVEARKKIEASEKQFKNVLLYSPNIFVILAGREMKITFVNEPLLNSWGRTWDIVGKTLVEAVPELKEQAFPALLDKVYRTGEPYYGKEEKAVLIKDGLPVDTYYNYIYQPIFESDETISGITIMATDITEQVKARKKIEESEKELQELFMKAPVSIILFEGENLVAKVANDTALRTIGKTKKEVINKPLLSFFPDLPQRTNIYRQVFETGISYEGKEVEIAFRRNDKTYSGYYDLNYTPWYGQDGKIKGVMTVGVDVTEKVVTRKKIENFSVELEQKVAERTAQLENKNIELEDTQEKLEQRNIELSKSLHELEILFGQLQEQKLKDEQKDDFILMASHELKTPVTTINGYVQLLMDMTASAKNAAGMDIALFDSPLKTIHKQISKLTSLISELLDLSKIQKGQLELHKTTFYLSELVSDVVKDIQYTTRHKIDLTVHSEDKVHADKDRIMQVVINFITNAVKYSPDADKIEIEVFKEGNSEAAVTVKDYGIGIDKVDRKKIFERFYRGGGKKERTFPGFGIGLFIASDIIKRHNGKISVKSKKNKGSEFMFTLPLQKKNAE